jgi:hypothetical protein
LEQLTQMELLQVRELFGQERLAVKKCLVYANKTEDAQLRQLFDTAATLHQSQVDNLITQLRRHDGRPPQTTEQ